MLPPVSVKLAVAYALNGARTPVGRRSRAVARRIALPGPYRWFVAHDVSGADACPDGWACFFQNPDFNAQASGWEILVQDDAKT